MKKLITISTVLTTVSVGLAQTNTATLSQVGTAQTSEQYQTGRYQLSTITQGNDVLNNYGNYAGTFQTATGSAGNTATVNQTDRSNANRAGVTQSGGSGNNATIDQRNSSGSSGSVLLVTNQTTINAVLSAGGNWSGILQQGSGNANTFISQQNGSSANFAEIYQYGDNNGQTSIVQANESLRNKAILRQGTASTGASENLATIFQQGFSSSDNEAMITQLTDRNEARIQQSVISFSNKAAITQTGGDGSKAGIEQYNASSLNAATITQQAGDNRAFIDQNNQSQGNTAVITQQGGNGTNDGTGNYGLISQSGYPTSSNYASLLQTGDNGQALVYQSRTYSTSATVEQAGLANYARIDQVTGNTNSASIRQNWNVKSGHDNVAEIRQGAPSNPGSSANAAFSNVATITQEYSRNTARLFQIGIGNQGDITQIGDNNVVQNASAAVNSFANQQGTNNRLTIVQDSGTGPTFVPNIANVFQAGTGNVITIVQTGR